MLTLYELKLSGSNHLFVSWLGFYQILVSENEDLIITDFGLSLRCKSDDLTVHLEAGASKGGNISHLGNVWLF